MAIRRALHAAGFRYRVDRRPSPELRTRADVVFTERKIAVFVDGCFWHGCPSHSTFPKKNADFSLPKLKRNVKRDIETNAKLVSLGWEVLRFGEHEKVDDVVGSIADAYAARGRKSPP